MDGWPITIVDVLDMCGSLIWDDVMATMGKFKSVVDNY